MCGRRPKREEEKKRKERRGEKRSEVREFEFSKNRTLISDGARSWHFLQLIDEFVPRYWLSTFGRRTFSVAGPTV